MNQEFALFSSSQEALFCCTLSAVKLWGIEGAIYEICTFPKLDNCATSLQLLLMTLNWKGSHYSTCSVFVVPAHCLFILH